MMSRQVCLDALPEAGGCALPVPSLAVDLPRPSARSSFKRPRILHRPQPGRRRSVSQDCPTFPSKLGFFLASLISCVLLSGLLHEGSHKYLLKQDCDTFNCLLCLLYTVNVKKERVAVPVKGE